MIARKLKLFLFVACLASVQPAVGASLTVYIGEPDAQTSGATGATVTTANFDSLTTGLDRTNYTLTNFGTFNFSHATPIEVANADQFGGAGGTGKYIALGAESGTTAPVTVNFSAAGGVNYLGLWWSASDPNNTLALYNGTTLLQTLTNSQVMTLLSGTTVTAINGSVYNSANYFGNPTTNFNGQDGTEAFYYLDLVVAGTTITSVQIGNSGSTATGFESDNWSVASGTVTVPTTDVPVTTFTIVPEPSQYATIFGGIIFCLVAGHRLLKKRQLAFAFKAVRR